VLVFALREKETLKLPGTTGFPAPDWIEISRPIDDNTKTQGSKGVVTIG